MTLHRFDKNQQHEENLGPDLTQNANYPNPNGDHSPSQPTGGNDSNNTPGKWQKRLEALARKIAIPLNNLAMGRGCESFVPLTMEQECAKAARILRSFTYHPAPTAGIDNKSLLTITPSSIASAQGILIFTTGRLGLSRLSGSTGSGILITRRQSPPPDEPPTQCPDCPSPPETAREISLQDQKRELRMRWNNPIAVQTHGVGLGLLAVGFDVSDRVYLIHERDELDRIFDKGQFTVGPEVVLAMGGWGGGAGLTFSGSFQEVRRAVERGREGIWHGGTRNMHGHGHAQAGGNHCGHCEQNRKQPVEQVEDMKAKEEAIWGGEAEHGSDEKKSILLNTKPANTQPVADETGQSSHHKESNPPTNCYMRSHGLYAGLQAEGTVFAERTEINRVFYGGAHPASNLPPPYQLGADNWRGWEALDIRGWRDGAESRAVEGVWEALWEAEFGSHHQAAPVED